jgi:hypothetical protein
MPNAMAWGVSGVGGVVMLMMMGSRPKTRKRTRLTVVRVNGMVVLGM